MGENTQLQRVRDIFDILHGKKPADLLLRNLKILDVHGESVYDGSLLIHNKRIIALNPEEGKFEARETFDGQGLYAIPGLIDAHFHSESQLVNPTALAEAMVPNGTTTIFAECLDLIGSAGKEGVEAANSAGRSHRRRRPRPCRGKQPISAPTPARVCRRSHSANHLCQGVSHSSPKYRINRRHSTQLPRSSQNGTLNRKTSNRRLKLRLEVFDMSEKTGCQPLDLLPPSTLAYSLGMFVLTILR